MLNKVTLIGRLGKDPEVRAFENGTKKARVSLATDEWYKDHTGNFVQTTEWHNLVFWRELADRAERDLKKGTLVYVEGKIEYREWNDQDGTKRNATDIKVHTFRVLTGKRESPTDNGESAPSQQQPVYKAKTDEPVAVNVGFTPTDDDLPF